MKVFLMTALCSTIAHLWGQLGSDGLIDKQILPQIALEVNKSDKNVVIYAFFDVINSMTNIPVENARIDITSERDSITAYTNHDGKVENILLMPNTTYTIKTTKDDLFMFDKIHTAHFHENTLIYKEYFLSPQGAGPFLDDN